MNLDTCANILKIMMAKDNGINHLLPESDRDKNRTALLEITKGNLQEQDEFVQGLYRNMAVFLECCRNFIEKYKPGSQNEGSHSETKSN
ncbi:MAG: hypothetical protein OXF85_01935 [Candidatus Saccharibacteria bacterium]|nr:hypothetical protein [Candidatus Saccharibacteria bacterium]